MSLLNVHEKKKGSREKYYSNNLIDAYVSPPFRLFQISPKG